MIIEVPNSTPDIYALAVQRQQNIQTAIVTIPANSWTASETLENIYEATIAFTPEGDVPIELLYENPMFMAQYTIDEGNLDNFELCKKYEIRIKSLEHTELEDTYTLVAYATEHPTDNPHPPWDTSLSLLIYGDNGIGSMPATTPVKDYVAAHCIGPWDPDTTYDLNSFCVYEGMVFVSLSADNIGKNPETQTAYWRPVLYCDDTGALISEKYATKAEIEGLVTESEFEQHAEDTTIHVTAQEKQTWNGKQDALVNGNYTTVSGNKVNHNTPTAGSGTEYGDASKTLVIKKDTYGHITTITPTDIAITEAQVSGLSTDLTTLTDGISAINAKIPAEATSSNKLADKAYVNSSIATATANFLGTFDALTDLGISQQSIDEMTDPPDSSTEFLVAQKITIVLTSLSVVPTTNDYVFVSVNQTPTGDGTDWYWRFKYDGTDWLYEYTLNNSSFTADQWAAINSKISNSGTTGIDVQTILSHLSNTSNPHNVTKSQVGLGNVENVALSTKVVASTGSGKNPIFINSSGVTAASDSTEGTSSTPVYLNAGTLTAVSSINTSLISAATTSANGLMSSTDKTKLNGIASGAEVNVQSDWNVTDSTSDAFIKNKPTIPTVNNGKLTIQGNGTAASEFTANQSGNTTLNIKGSGGTSVSRSAANEITISTGTIPDISTKANVNLNNISGLDTTQAGKAILVSSTGSIEFGEAGKVDDVRVNGISVVSNKIANVSVPVSSVNTQTGAVVLDGADIKLDGYAKPLSTSAIVTTDTINAALGKLEKALDGKQPSGNYATTAQLTDGSVTKVGTSTVGGTLKIMYLDAGTPTNGTQLYNKNITLNGSTTNHNVISQNNSFSLSFYAPTGAGTAGQYLKSTAGIPSWQSADTSPTSGSTNLITSGAVYTAVSSIPYTNITGNPFILGNTFSLTEVD